VQAAALLEVGSTVAGAMPWRALSASVRPAGGVAQCALAWLPRLSRVVLQTMRRVEDARWLVWRPAVHLSLSSAVLPKLPMRIPLQNPKSAELLPSWRAQPGMLGVRLTFLGPAAKWLDDGTADWFWPAAEKAGLPVMFLAPGRGANMVRVAERHPQLHLIVDHMGMSLSDEAIRAGKFEGAINDTLTLAKYPNVSVKLSAAPNYSKEPYPYRDINPHIKLLFDAFGPQRCYWGTDITNGFARATLRQRVTQFTEALDFLTEDDKDWVMGRAIIERLKWS
jgi:hypothetical protein